MKKAQIQYMETIFVLLILIVIIFIGVIIFYSYYTNSLNEKRERFTDIDSVTLTSSIINMPEFTCGKNTHCIDATKIISFQETIQNNNYYKILFQNMDITLDLVFPETRNTDLCDIQKFNQNEFPTNCGQFELVKSNSLLTTKEIIQTPVQIHFPSIDKKALGVLNIIIYKK